MRLGPRPDIVSKILRLAVFSLTFGLLRKNQYVVVSSLAELE